jgi:hypothetical protein
MVLRQYTVEFVAGVAHSEKRGVAFLRGDPELNAGSTFDLTESKAVGKRIRHRIALWIQWKPDTNGKFHGFGEPKYRECFTFIDIEEKIRYYGFRCHPKPDDPRYELIVLTSCVVKKEDAADKGELDRVLIWKNHMCTKQALTEKFSKKDSQKKK